MFDKPAHVIAFFAMRFEIEKFCGAANEAL
jgi:hypothetical protein